MSIQTPPRTGRKIEEFESVTVRFAGDSGDGMQLTGPVHATAVMIGNDVPLSGLPGRDPGAGRLLARRLRVPVRPEPRHPHAGDAPDARGHERAALKVNIGDLKPNGILPVNVDRSRSRPKLAHYASNLLEDHPA
jgi:2-oxoglutarate ferredoxin oxidoreductase subunit alpha